MALMRDREILDMVAGGKLVASSFSEKNLTPNGYDLTIDSIRIEGSDRNSDQANVPPHSTFWISTLERLDMPGDVGGQIWIRSSYARKGVFASFGFVDAGFRGNLTLAFFNGSSSEISVRKGETIAQITFVKLDGKAESTYEHRSGNYQDQAGIRL